MKQAYQDFKFKATTLELLDKANAIIDEYLAQGFRLTVRQLYYQLVARGEIPNNMKSYTRVAITLNDGRLAGYVDWDAIEDRTREFLRRSRWTSAKDILEACASSFHMDMWTGQPVRPFVIVEKEALAGVLEGVCRKWDVPLLAARGYPSVSVLREFALQDILPAMRRQSQEVMILHLGDHDPSGIDMTRDLRERLGLFLGQHNLALEIRRIALNMGQVTQYQPPPNPAKVTDSRFIEYQARYGDESWELDALEPRVLASLVESNIKPIVDKAAWQERVDEINEAKEYITTVAQEAP